MADSLAEARSHNVPAEVFLRHWREVREAKNAKDDAAAGVARAKKSAKQSGINLEAFKIVEQFNDMDTDELEMLLKDIIAYSKWMKLPVGTQMEMWAQPDVAMPNDAAQQQHDEWQAGQDGLQAGQLGHERDTNPHEPGSASHVSWDKQWAKGNKQWMREQTDRADKLGENAGVTSSGRGRRAAGNGAEAHA
jgi:hypothetical protein